MEEILQSIKREMGEDHAAFVNTQLKDASKRCKELQASLPDVSDAIDPFAEMPPLCERNANAQVKDQVDFPLSPISVLKPITC
jgi:hypothetical protein